VPVIMATHQSLGIPGNIREFPVPVIMATHQSLGILGNIGEFPSV